MNASYVNVNAFTVSGDETDLLVVRRRVRCDCGVDGYKYRTIKSSTYGAPNTSVQLEPDSDQDLTANLDSILSSVCSSGSTGGIPHHTHNEAFGQGGNILRKHFIL